jgi:hypothetical protein
MKERKIFSMLGIDPCYSAWSSSLYHRIIPITFGGTINRNNIPAPQIMKILEYKGYYYLTQCGVCSSLAL